MKKLFMLVALMFGLASCQNEPEDLNVVVGGEQDVMINVSLPDETRTGSADGFNLASLKNDNNYQFRYILEIYLDGGTDDQKYRDVKYSDETSISFPVRLAPGRAYSFAVWADVVKQVKNPTNLYYNTESLKNISINESNWTAMDEKRDAFYGKASLGTNDHVAGMSTITLKRPFAKVRVISTDIGVVRNFGLAPTNVSVEYLSPLYTSFNAVSGEVCGTTTSNKVVTANYATAKYDDFDTAEATLFADYIFVPADDTIQFAMEVFAGTSEINDPSFTTPIPVEVNKVTTIKGDILTEGGNVSVKIENELGEKETINFVDSAYSLQKAINKAEDGRKTTIKLGDDIVVETATTRAENQYGIVIPANKVIVLDLNGKSISQTKAQSGKYAMIENNGTLTIANGTISYGDSAALTADVGYTSNTIQNNGVLTINEGTTLLNTSGTAVATYGFPHVIDTNGTLTINGGTLTNEANYSTIRIWTSNTDAEKCKVTINGGTFKGCIDFQAHNNNSATIPHYGTLTVNGGIFIPDSFTSSAIRVLRFAANANDMHATINGGNFNGKVWIRNIGSFAETPKIFNIYGGTFTAAAKTNTSKEHLADGYAFIEDENGNWTVASLGYYADANGNYHITGVNGWLWMADQNDNFFRNKTIYLDNDIDFAGVKVGVTKCYYPEYYATFDGQNHTVSNIWMGYNYASSNQALFDGSMNIKNLTVDRTEVYGVNTVGIIGANIFGKIENCHVKNSRAYCYGWQVGGIVGLHSWDDIVNCSVEDTRVECYCYGAVGAIAGCMNEMSRNITNCSVKDCRLIREYSSTDYAFYENMYGAFVGCIVASGNFTFSGTIENTTIKGAASSQVYGEVYPGCSASVTFNGEAL